MGLLGIRSYTAHLPSGHAHGHYILCCRFPIDAAFPLHLTARSFWFLVRAGPLVNSLSMVLSGDQCQIHRGDISWVR